MSFRVFSYTKVTVRIKIKFSVHVFENSSYWLHHFIKFQNLTCNKIYNINDYNRIDVS